MHSSVSIWFLPPSKITIYLPPANVKRKIRAGAVVGMKVEGYYIQKRRGWVRLHRRGWVRLHEKGGKVNELPCHHNLDAISQGNGRNTGSSRNQTGGGPVAMLKTTPHDKRRGRLKNDNPPGDFTRAARCGAKTRRGTPCQCPAMRNGRCRLHGGLSTGPKTAEGIERIRRAVTKHGNYSKRAKGERAEYRELLRACRKMLATVE
jgi:hypothetical protein